MAVDERRRKQLHDALERELGPDEAATMMELVPRGDPEELATKRDVQALEAKMEAMESRVEAKMEAMESRVEAKVEGIRVEMHDSARRVVMWTSSMVVAMAGLAFAAGKFI